MSHIQNLQSLQTLKNVGSNSGSGGSKYILLDTFAGTLAAGAVNGTFSDSGSLRTVTDTNSKISIGSGVLNFATGAVAFDGIWWPSTTRLLGRLMIGTMVIDAATEKYIGFNTIQSGQPVHGAVRFVAGGSTLLLTSNIANGPVVGTYTATSYQVAIVLRAAGTFAFIKGGAFTTWTLLWIESVDSNATLYPAVVTGGSSVFTADNIKIPTLTWYPIPTASDSFNRANGAIGSTDGAAIAETGGASLAWTGSTYTISTNAAINSPTLGSDVITNGGFASDTVWTKGTGWTIAAGVGTHASGTASNITQATGTVGTWYQVDWTVTSFVAGQFSPIWGSTNATVKRTSAATFVDVGRSIANTNLGISTNSTADGNIDNVSFKPLTLSELFASITSSQANDVIASVNVTLVTGCPAGVVMNLDSTSSPANFIIAYHDGTNAKLDKCVAGTYTNIISAAATYSAGATLRVVKQGTTYILFYNNAAVGSISTISDAGIISNTIHGLFSTYPGNTLDNFYIFPSGTGNEFSMLDSL